MRRKSGTLGRVKEVWDASFLPDDDALRLPMTAVTSSSVPGHARMKDAEDMSANMERET